MLLSTYYQINANKLRLHKNVDQNYLPLLILLKNPGSFSHITLSFTWMLLNPL